MTVITTIAAYWVLVIVVLEVFGVPFMFGKLREPWNARAWLINIVAVVPPLIILAADALLT